MLTIIVSTVMDSGNDGGTWVLLLVVIVVAAGMICWLKTRKKFEGIHFLVLNL